MIKVLVYIWRNLILIPRKFKLLIFLFKISIIHLLYHSRSPKHLCFESLEFILKDDLDAYLNATDFWKTNIKELEIQIIKNPFSILKVPRFQVAFQVITYDLNNFPLYQSYTIRHNKIKSVIIKVYKKASIAFIFI